MGVILKFLKDLEEELQLNTDHSQPVYLTINGSLHIGGTFYYCNKDCSDQKEEDESVNEAYK